MKKSLAILLTFVLMLSLGACGGGKTASPASDGGSAAVAEKDDNAAAQIGIVTGEKTEEKEAEPAQESTESEEPAAEAGKDQENTAPEELAEEPAEETRYYKMTGMTNDGQEATAEQISQAEEIGQLPWMALMPDGTMTLSGFGNDVTGEWTETELIADGDPASYTLEGDVLTVVSEDMTMVFTRVTKEEIEEILSHAESNDEEPEEESSVDKIIISEGDSIAGDGYEVSFDSFVLDSKGYTVNITLSNTSENTEFGFNVDTGTVNRYTVDPFWARSAAAGEVKKETITYDAEDMEYYGTGEPEEVGMRFEVYNRDTYEEDAYDLYFYPTGKTADSITVPDRFTTEWEEVLVDNEKCSFVILGVNPDGDWGYTVIAYLENKTDSSAMFSWDDVTVNGIEIDPFWATNIMPGSRGYAEIDFDEEDFEENGITDVSEIKFELSIYNDDDWNVDDYVDEEFTYNP